MKLKKKRIVELIEQLEQIENEAKALEKKYEKRLKKMQTIFLNQDKHQVALTYKKNKTIFDIDLVYANSNFLGDKLLFGRFKKDLKIFDSKATIQKIK